MGSRKKTFYTRTGGGGGVERTRSLRTQSEQHQGEARVCTRKRSDCKVYFVPFLCFSFLKKFFLFFVARRKKKE